MGGRVGGEAGELFLGEFGGEGGREAGGGEGGERVGGVGVEEGVEVVEVVEDVLAGGFCGEGVGRGVFVGEGVGDNVGDVGVFLEEGGVGGEEGVVEDGRVVCKGFFDEGGELGLGGRVEEVGAVGDEAEDLGGDVEEREGVELDVGGDEEELAGIGVPPVDAELGVRESGFEGDAEGLGRVGEDEFEAFEEDEGDAGIDVVVGGFAGVTFGDVGVDECAEGGETAGFEVGEVLEEVGGDGRVEDGSVVFHEFLFADEVVVDGGEDVHVPFFAVFFGGFVGARGGGVEDCAFFRVEFLDELEEGGVHAIGDVEFGRGLGVDGVVGIVRVGVDGEEGGVADKAGGDRALGDGGFGGFGVFWVFGGVDGGRLLFRSVFPCRFGCRFRFGQSAGLATMAAFVRDRTHRRVLGASRQNHHAWQITPIKTGLGL